MKTSGFARRHALLTSVCIHSLEIRNSWEGRIVAVGIPAFLPLALRQLSFQVEPIHELLSFAVSRRRVGSLAPKPAPFELRSEEGLRRRAVFPSVEQIVQ